jgi:probable rRNA maturation factor
MSIRIDSCNETDFKNPLTIFEYKCLKRAMKTELEEGHRYSLSVTYINDKLMEELNSTYRQINKPTDVLSFAFLDGEEQRFEIPETLLGDIYIDLEYIQKNTTGVFKDEVAFIFIHGFLHLLGYDHQNDEDEAKMNDKTKQILEVYKKEKQNG